MARVYHLGNLPQGLKALAFRELGMVMQENGTAAYAQFLLRDMARYAAVVSRLNLQVK